MKPVQELTIEDLQNMNALERMTALHQRSLWLTASRAAEKKAHNTEAKTSTALTWKLKGLCPHCKEHGPIHKQGRCKTCYQKYR